MKPRWNHPTIAISLVIAFAPAGRATLAGQNASPPHRLDLELTIPQRQIVTFAPVIAKITLTNRGNLPYELSVRTNGAPYAVVCMIAHKGEDYFEHDQWIRRSGPQKHQLVLAPGDSTSGDILVFLGPPTGFAFGEPGTHHLQFAFQPDPGFAPLYTNRIELSVVPDDLQNRAFLEELSELAYEYFGFDREVIRRNAGDSILIGYELIHEILKVQRPHFVDPDGDRHNRKQARLMGRLSEMLERFPDNSYSGYIARFLGLIHVKTFQHEISSRGAGSWGETKVSRDHQEVTRLCQSEYDKALRYLTIASQADLWPRTTATLNLARLHGIAEEWAKVSVVCGKLWTDYTEQNGAALADKLESEMRKYREKIARRKKAD